MGGMYISSMGVCARSALAHCVRVSEISGSEIGIFELGNN